MKRHRMRIAYLLALLVTPVSAQDSQPAWQIDLIIKNETSEISRSFGTQTDATEGFDLGLDQVVPPAGFGYSAAFNITTFPHWLEVDIRPASTANQTWSLVISNSNGSTSTISWDRSLTETQKAHIKTLTIDGIDMLTQDSLQVTGDRTVAISFEADSPTRVAGSEAGAVPADFQLLQSYPNPVGISTKNVITIEFTASAPARVELVVYNIIGQRVKTLLNSQLTSGDHRIQWDGRDSAGLAVPAGVYIYVLRSGDFSATRRVVLLD